MIWHNFFVSLSCQRLNCKISFPGYLDESTVSFLRLFLVCFYLPLISHYVSLVKIHIILVFASDPALASPHFRCSQSVSGWLAWTPPATLATALHSKTRELLRSGPARTMKKIVNLDSNAKADHLQFLFFCV